MMEMTEMETLSSVTQQRLAEFQRLYHERVCCVKAIAQLSSSQSCPTTPVLSSSQSCPNTPVSPMLPIFTPTPIPKPSTPVLTASGPIVTPPAPTLTPSLSIDESIDDQDALRCLLSRKKTLDENLSAFARDILQARSVLTTRFDGTSRRIEAALDVLLQQELRQWNREQRLATSGLPNASFLSSSSSSSISTTSISAPSSKPLTSLQQIRSKAQRLADALWRMSRCVEATRRCMDQLPDSRSSGQTARRQLEDVAERTTRQISTLFAGTMIIDRQPPQVFGQRS